jgi:MFS family permease
MMGIGEPPRADKSLLVMTFVAMAISTVVSALPAMCAIPIADELSLNKREIGLYLSSAIWGIMIGFPLGGPLADRFGYRFPIVLGFLCGLGGLIAISQAPGFETLLIGGVCVGLGTGLWEVLLTPLALAATPKHPVRVCNLLHAMFPAGEIVIATVAWLMMEREASWRTIYIVCFCMTIPIALSLAFIRLPKRSPENPGHLPLRNYVLAGPFIIMAVAIALGSVPECGARAWIPTLISSEVKGSLLFEAWLGLVCYDAAVAIGRFFGGSVVHRLGVKLAFVIGGLGSAVCFVLATASTGTVATITWLCLAGLGVSFFWPTILGCAQDRYPGAGSVIFSVLSTTGVFGSMLGPVLVGQIAESTSIRSAVGMLAVMPLLTFLFVVMLPKRSKN